MVSKTESFVQDICLLKLESRPCRYPTIKHCKPTYFISISTKPLSDIVSDNIPIVMDVRYLFRFYKLRPYTPTYDDTHRTVSYILQRHYAVNRR